MTALVEIRGLEKRFGAVTALAGVDLDIERGEVVCLIGPSGSGKSTLLRCINWLEQPSAGTVRVAGRLVGEVEENGKRRPMRGRALAAIRADIGMVFQMFHLWPHLSAIDNVMLALVEVKKMPESEAAERARAAMAKVGLGDKLLAFPEQLSGGQRQRVAIARALDMEPLLILFDEPTSALDPELVGEVLGVMERLAAEGTTMVVATHEMGFARKAANRIVFLDQGRVVEQGAPAELFDRSRSDRLRRFLDSVLKVHA